MQIRKQTFETDFYSKCQVIRVPDNEVCIYRWRTQYITLQIHNIDTWSVSPVLMRSFENHPPVSAMPAFADARHGLQRHM